MKRLLVLCALTSVAALLAVTGSSAAPSGGTISVSPSAPLLGDSLVFTGCGWNTTNPNGTQNTVIINIQQPDYSYDGVTVVVAKSGCFTTSGTFTDPFTGLPGDYRAPQAGTYSVLAFQKYRQAALSFTVG